MSFRSYSFAPVATAALVVLMMAPPGGGPGGPGGGNGGGNGGGKGKSNVELYVDPVLGNDTNDGSQDFPFASLERAQVEARAAAEDQAADLEVILSDGAHLRDSTFELTAADSGRNGFSVTYRSVDGGAAILEGGVELSGWQATGDGLYAVDVPGELPGFRQFYADSVRQPRARSALASGSATEFLKELVGPNLKDVAMVVPDAVLAGIAHPEDLELLYVGVLVSGHGILHSNGSELVRPSWRSHRLQVEQVTPYAAGLSRVDIQQDALFHASARGSATTFITPQDPFYLENAIELLNEPGEWFFDPRDHKLFWLPPDGVDPNQVETWVPGVETLLDLNGTPAAPVENLRFEGLVFRHSTYLLTNEEGYISGQGPSWFTGWEFDDWMEDNGASHSYLSAFIRQGLPGAAVEVDSAAHIEFVGNVFAELGAAGVLLHNDVTDTTFAGNVFDDISGSGLIAGHPEHVFVDEPMERLIERVTFENNLVARVGREYFTAVGVRVFKAADFEISHNRFTDMPYSAISLGWGHNNFPESDVHKRNEVLNNSFDNVMHTLYDGAAVYLLGPAAEIGAAASEGTTVSGNYIDYSNSSAPVKLPKDTVDPSFAKRPGLQFDDGTRNVSVSKNVVVDGSVWFQLTAWFFRSNQEGFVETLGLSGSNNWANSEASVPTDLSLINLADVKLFNPDGKLPKPLQKIVDAAGVQSNVTLPAVP